MVKNSLLLLGILLSLSSIPLVSAETKTEFIETGEKVEVKDPATKMFIHEVLQPWLTQDMADLYYKEYQAKKSVELEVPKPDNVRIWMKEVKSINSKYTHLITVYLPYEKVTLDGKKQMKTADTFTYAVNATQLPVCHDKNGFRNCVKLVDSYHKVISE